MFKAGFQTSKEGIKLISNLRDINQKLKKRSSWTYFHLERRMKWCEKHHEYDWNKVILLMRPLLNNEVDVYRKIKPSEQNVTS